MVHALRIRKKTECHDKPCCGQEPNSIPAPKHRDTTRKSVQDKIQTTLMMSPASNKGLIAFVGLAVLAGLIMGYGLSRALGSNPMVSVGAGLGGSCTLAYALHGVCPVIWNEMCQGFLVLCGAVGGLAGGFWLFGGNMSMFALLAGKVSNNGQPS